MDVSKKLEAAWPPSSQKMRVSSQVRLKTQEEWETLFDSLNLFIIMLSILKEKSSEDLIITYLKGAPKPSVPER